MPTATLLSWWRANRRSLLVGLGFGLLWGFLMAGTATPPEWLVYDETAGIVYKYWGSASPARAVPAELFFAEYQSVLLQATLIFLVVVGTAGWATWQHTRVRPRGEEQPSLRLGMDWYLIGLALGGLAFVWFFRSLGWAEWFKGPRPTPATVLRSVLGFLLPLYAGVSVFLVWFRRLSSVRAPDWETHFPKPRKKAGKP